MDTTRREFLQVTGGATSSLALSKAYAAKPEILKAKTPIRILILGGTGFTGPHQIAYALNRGHQVTVFNRGKTKPTTHLGIFDNVEQLNGDRSNDLTSLKGGKWDAVIDNSASIPRWVRESAQLLKASARIYLFTSSLSVHTDFSQEGLGEDAPVATTDEPNAEEVEGGNYGALKALCEAETRKAFPNGAIIVRPHLIVGPGDRSDRWTYWPVRIDRGGEVMAPGQPEFSTQYIDARDLAEFDIRLVENEATGVYSAVGPLARLSMGEMLHGIRAIVSNRISFTWVSAEFLAEHEVAAWSEMTAWVPPTGNMAGFAAVDNSRAAVAGLTYRPLAVTAKDTLDWWKTLPEERTDNPRAGLEPEKERKVLDAWHQRA